MSCFRMSKLNCLSFMSGVLIAAMLCGFMYQYDGTVHYRVKYPKEVHNIATPSVAREREPAILSQIDKLLLIQQARLQQVENYCKNVRTPYNISIDFASIVDDAHELILVSIPKTGCTMWKLAMYENIDKIPPQTDHKQQPPKRQKRAAPKQTGQNVRDQHAVSKTKNTPVSNSNVKKPKGSSSKTQRHAAIHNFKFIKSQGLRWVHDLNPSERKELLESYFNVLTVRHPLDRLESSYQDKVVHYMQNSEPIRMNLVKYLAKQHGVIIKNYTHKTAPMQFQKNTTFQNFLAFILQDRNRHWNSVMGNAHPCSVPYSFIAKTETLNMDLEYVIGEKLSGKGKPKTMNSFRSPKNATELERHLPLFSQLKEPEYWIQKIMVQYQDDMDMFGYSYTIRHGQVYARCTKYMYGDICV